MAAKRRNEERARIDALPDIDVDPHSCESGVLLSDEIQFYVTHGKLIDPFVESNLKAAGYELTVGDEAILGGTYYALGDSAGSNKLKIPPFEVAVIKTGETVNLPRFMIARWNIRVAWAYKGLLWVGGPQVDPGFAGHLFCPLYNLSDKEVLLTKGDSIALIDFVKTTPFSSGKKYSSVGPKPYDRPPGRVIIDDYKIEDFKSALFSHGIEVKEGLNFIRNRVDFFITIVFAILAILLAAMVYVNFDGNQRRQAIPSSTEWGIGLWGALPLALSLFAVALSFMAYRAPSNPKIQKLLPFIVGTFLGAGVTTAILCIW